MAWKFGAVLVGFAAAAGGSAVAVFDYENRVSSVPARNNPLSGSSPSELAASHDDAKLGNDHCDCTPLWECMVAKCHGESCKACDYLDIQLRTCLAKVMISLRLMLQPTPIGSQHTHTHCAHRSRAAMDEAKRPPPAERFLALRGTSKVTSPLLPNSSQRPSHWGGLVCLLCPNGGGGGMGSSCTSV